MIVEHCGANMVVVLRIIAGAIPQKHSTYFNRIQRLVSLLQKPAAHSSVRHYAGIFFTEPAVAVLGY